jgi:DNA-binding CsgD family transcriptional regulator
MTKSDTLRVQDARDAYRLIGECRDVGGHPALWHRRMLEGLFRLFGAILASGGEGWWDRPSQPIQPISAYSASADPAAVNAVEAYHRAQATSSDLIFRAIQTRPGRLVTVTRRQLVGDRGWYGSLSAEYRRIGGIDHVLTSVFQLSDSRAISAIALNRAIGDRDFSPRERRFLHFFHEEIGRLIGGPLVSATEPDLMHLSPRLQETLAYLLQGDGEKQVASRLGLSTATVHQYVTALYRRFGVQSRAQLLVRVLQRMPSRQNDRGDGAVAELNPALGLPTSMDRKSRACA